MRNPVCEILKLGDKTDEEILLFLEHSTGVTMCFSDLFLNCHINIIATIVPMSIPLWKI